MEVIKRDGRVVQYDPSKVRRAIREAFKAVDKELTNDDKEKVEQIAKYIDDFTQPNITVEEIQDFIEHKLMSSNRKDVAKSYIIYRNNRTIEREKNSTIVRKVARRINANNVENSNANVDERSFSGREKEASSDVGKAMALDYGGLSRKVAQAHKDMLVYGHDLERAVYGVHNCCKDTTLFLTTQGIKSFADFEDGDEVEVYTHLGRIKKAIVKSGGVQQLYKLTFKKGEEFIIEYFTENHRWYLDDTTITDKIKVGDKLLKTPKINVKYIDLDDNVFNDIAELVGIEKDSLEEVWCLQVEDDRSFILASGLVTGNCLFLDFQEIFANGFKTRNGDVRPPATFGTACQQVAVAFQCQSQVY